MDDLVPSGDFREESLVHGHPAVISAFDDYRPCCCHLIKRRGLPSWNPTRRFGSPSVLMSSGYGSDDLEERRIAIRASTGHPYRTGSASVRKSSDATRGSSADSRKPVRHRLGGHQYVGLAMDTGRESTYDRNALAETALWAKKRRIDVRAEDLPVGVQPHHDGHRLSTPRLSATRGDGPVELTPGLARDVPVTTCIDRPSPPRS